MVSCQAVGTTWPSLVAFRLTDSGACRLENKKKQKLWSLWFPWLDPYCVVCTYFSPLPLHQTYFRLEVAIWTKVWKRGGKCSFTVFCESTVIWFPLLNNKYWLSPLVGMESQILSYKLRTNKLVIAVAFVVCLTVTFWLRHGQYEQSTFATLALGSSFILNAQTWDSLIWLWAK